MANVKFGGNQVAFDTDPVVFNTSFEGDAAVAFGHPALAGTGAESLSATATLTIGHPLIAGAGTGAPVVAGADHGFTLKVNGVDYDLPAFNSEQLRSLHLADAAFDAQIGSGTFVLPGSPGWLAGDRLAFYADDDDATFIGDYFVTDRGQKRQSIETGAIETSYNIMDVNRHLIGWRLIDELVNPGAGGDTSLFIGTIVTRLAHLTLDSTTWVDADATVMPEKTYFSDGAMDIIGDLILYTGKTVFLRATADDEYELHFHALNDGPVGTVAISDDPGDVFDADTFSPVGASVTWSAADLKTVVEIRNSIGEIVAGGDSAHTGPHSTGGLRWDFQGSYAVDQSDLTFLANTLLETGGLERPTGSCVIGPLTGAQVAALPPGSRPAAFTSEVMADLDSTYIRQRGLSVWTDGAGNPVPGLWTVSLEFAFPIRQPTAVIGYGGQGGYSGLLYDPFNFADHVRVDYGDVWPPVGQSAVVYGHLEGTVGNAVTDKGIQIDFAIEQFTDEAETAPCSDFSLDFDHALTGDGGIAVVLLTHDADTGCVKMRVVGSVGGT